MARKLPSLKTFQHLTNFAFSVSTNSRGRLGPTVLACFGECYGNGIRFGLPVSDYFTWRTLCLHFRLHSDSLLVEIEKSAARAEIIVQDIEYAKAVDGFSVYPGGFFL
jgi:hypothetical protein